MRCLAQRSTVADAISGLTATNGTARTRAVGGWRALRRGIALGLDTLGIGRPDVLGWSMGGMIAQALAVLHPAQVRRLVLCATYPGTGAVVPSQAAIRTGSLFLLIRSTPTTRSQQRSRNTQPPPRRRPMRKRLRRPP
jgi:pimeloyl-ACP methyl ester carboxylesterase